MTEYSKIKNCCAICQHFKKGETDCPLSIIWENDSNGDVDETAKFKLKCNSFKLCDAIEIEDETTNPLVDFPTSIPFPDVYKSTQYLYHHCKTWEDCTNPLFDCINCPLRTGGGWTTTNTWPSIDNSKVTRTGTTNDIVDTTHTDDKR